MMLWFLTGMFCIYLFSCISLGIYQVIFSTEDPNCTLRKKQQRRQSGRNKSMSALSVWSRDTVLARWSPTDTKNCIFPFPQQPEITSTAALLRQKPSTQSKYRYSFPWLCSQAWFQCLLGMIVNGSLAPEHLEKELNRMPYTGFCYCWHMRTDGHKPQWKMDCQERD